MSGKKLPIDYAALVTYGGGKETVIGLDEPGWLSRPEMREIEWFTLQPKPGAKLPAVSVDLTPLPDGTPKRLVYVSRVLGRISQGESHDHVRLYCVGWQAVVAGRNVKSLAWVYPSGAIVMRDEPPWVDELIAAHAQPAEIVATCGPVA